MEGVPGPGRGECVWSRGVYLVPGVCVPGPGGVPGPGRGGYLVPGVCVPGPGGVPGPRGCTCPGEQVYLPGGQVYLPRHPPVDRQTGVKT